jgi:16S rRNA (cytosine1402-N4)-methyltransferase
MDEGIEFSHQPVLLEEVLEALSIKPEGAYIDATYGRGGHSTAILERLNERGRLLAIDKDPEAVGLAQKRYRGEHRFSVHAGSFASLMQLTDGLKLTGRIDGILLDLGVSSPQLDDPKRGFSFLREGPLDMRMDSTQNPSAAEWLASISEVELARVIEEYGEERHARRIAKAVVMARRQSRLDNTRRLAELIASVVPRREKNKHPATRTFQAIRIVINRELEELEAILPQSLGVLRKHGRLAVISFHSLEDRIVKQFFRRYSSKWRADIPRGLPVMGTELKPKLRTIGGLIRASQEERRGNPRARSAVLRVAERL